MPLRALARPRTNSAGSRDLSGDHEHRHLPDRRLTESAYQALRLLSPLNGSARSENCTSEEPKPKHP